MQITYKIYKREMMKIILSLALIMFFISCGGGDGGENAGGTTKIEDIDIENKNILIIYNPNDYAYNVYLSWAKKLGNSKVYKIDKSINCKAFGFEYQYENSTGLIYANQNSNLSCKEKYLKDGRDSVLITTSN